MFMVRKNAPRPRPAAEQHRPHVELGIAETIVGQRADFRGRKEPVFREKELRGKFRSCAAPSRGMWISDAAGWLILENPDRPGAGTTGTDQGRDRYFEETGRFDCRPYPKRTLRTTRHPRDPEFTDCGTWPGNTFLAEERRENCARSKPDATLACRFIDASRRTAMHLGPRNPDATRGIVGTDGVSGFEDRGGSDGACPGGCTEIRVRGVSATVEPHGRALDPSLTRPSGQMGPDRPRQRRPPWLDFIEPNRKQILHYI